MVSTMDNSLVTIGELAALGPSPHRFYQRAVGLDPFHTVDEAASVHVDWTAVRQR